MKSLRFIVGLITVVVLLQGCDTNSRDATEQLVSLVQAGDFNPTPVFMEVRGIFYTDKWFKVALYFGYGDNGNHEACIEEATRLNAKEGAGKYRCVLE